MTFLLVVFAARRPGALGWVEKYLYVSGEVATPGREKGQGGSHGSGDWVSMRNRGGFPCRRVDVGIPLLALLGQAYDRLECLMAALACVLEDCQVLLGRHLIQAPAEFLKWPGRSGPSICSFW